MNNLEDSGESLLRDKLLQHEFAADEQAWAKMDDLLTAQFPPAPPPTTPPAGLSWMMGGKWLLGLLVVGSIGWWLVPSGHPAVVDVDLLTSNQEQTDYVRNGERGISVGANSAVVIPVREVKSTILTKQSSEKGFDSAAIGKKEKAEHNRSISTNTLPLKSNDLLKPNHKNGGHDAGKYLSNRGNKAIKTPVSNSVKIATDSITADNKDIVIPNADSIVRLQLQANNKKDILHSNITALPQRNRALPETQWRPRGTVPAWTNPHRGHRIQLGIVGGGQLAYVNNNRYKGLTNSFTFGLSANYQLTASWALQADLLYRNVQNDLVANFVQSNLDASGHYYAWGYNVSSQYLAFIEMPLLVKKGFFNNHVHLSGGIRPAFVKPVYAFTGSYITSPYQSFATFQPSIRDGIRKFDLALSIGADLQIWRRLWIDIRVNQGIFDLSHDDFFQNTDTDVTTDAQLTLRYYFFAF